MIRRLENDALGPRGPRSGECAGACPRRRPCAGACPRRHPYAGTPARSRIRRALRPLAALAPLVLSSGFVGLAGPAAPAAPAAPSAPRVPASSLDVRLVTDEPDAVLAILDLRARDLPVADDDWTRLFTAEGYVRLARRERSLGRTFTDSAFRAFVLSPELAARAPALRRTLEEWRRLDVRAAAARALAYLPAGTELRARMYPEIKPAPNTFVFDLATDPAIFVYLDPSRSAAQTENTLAHELHHIGTAAACREQPDSTLPQTVRTALDWATAFGEGRAMLAAAGGPDIDPHATSPDSERVVWQRNLARVPGDLTRLAGFFDAVLDGGLKGDELRQRGFTFINAPGAPQGPFYTVGWVMAAVVEQELGRSRLVSSLCDPARFLADYQRAARAANRRGGGPVVRGAPEPLPLWPDALLGRLRGAGDAPAAGR